jgi:branched-subunit amino acid transport protein AzlD
MQRGFSVVQVGGFLLGAIVLGIALPILDPFLALGIGATGGITSYLLMALPFFMVAALVLYLFREQPRPVNTGW